MCAAIKKKNVRRILGSGRTSELRGRPAGRERTRIDTSVESEFTERESRVTSFARVSPGETDTLPRLSRSVRSPLPVISRVKNLLARSPDPSITLRNPRSLGPAVSSLSFFLSFCLARFCILVSIL